jgi:DNA polymerase III subunit delta
MIVTLTGENSFALQQELRRRVDAFADARGDLALERLDGETADAGRVQEALTSLPFLSDKKMVVLRDLSTNKRLAEQAEQLLGDVPETTDVILVEAKLDKRLAYYKFLKKETDFHDFPVLDAGGLARWLTAAARQQGGSLSPADARYLIERVGSDQQLLANELDKLLLRGPAITRAAIDSLTEATPQSTIFQLLDAAFAGNSRQALRLYAEQRAQSVEPIQIIAMLAWQLHVLAVVKTAGDRTAEAIAKESRINPFVVRKSQAITRTLSLGQLKRLIAELLRIDTQSKRTNIDTDEALQHYLLTLAA